MPPADGLSCKQKKPRIKALRKSLSPTAKLFSAKEAVIVAEKLVGVGGTSDVSPNEVKAQRLAEVRFFMDESPCVHRTSSKVSEPSCLNERAIFVICFGVSRILWFIHRSRLL